MTAVDKNLQFLDVPRHDPEKLPIEVRKSEFRKLWIARINAGCREEGMTYNRFIQGLNLAGIEVNRKQLAEMAVNDPAAFKAVVEAAKKALPEDVNAPQAA